MNEENQLTGRWLAGNEDFVKKAADDNETMRLRFLPYIVPLMTAVGEEAKLAIVKKVSAETSNRPVQVLLEHVHTRDFMASAVSFKAFSKWMMPSLRGAAEGGLIGTCGMVSLTIGIKSGLLTTTCDQLADNDRPDRVAEIHGEDPDF